MANIYVITNKLNNKQYVGQCVISIQKRFNRHLRDPNKSIPLHADMCKYGADNFTIELLDICDDNVRLAYETYYIDKLNTLQPNGYNVYRHQSNAFMGHKHTDEALNKISNASKQWWDTASEEQITARNEKIRKANTGKVFSVEHCEKLSLVAQQRVGDKNPFFGKHHTDITCSIIGEKNRKYDYYQYSLDGKILNIFYSMKSASEYVKETQDIPYKWQTVSHNIWKCLSPTQKNTSAYGFVWKQVLKSSSQCIDYPVKE